MMKTVFRMTGVCALVSLALGAGSTQAQIVKPPQADRSVQGAPLGGSDAPALNAEASSSPAGMAALPPDVAVRVNKARENLSSVRKPLAQLERGSVDELDSLDAVVKLALERNPLLAGQQQALQAGVEQFREAQASGAPTIGLNARVSVAEGGRTFEVPTGDLLNPVYRNLNALNAAAMNGAPTFPTLQNQTLNLLRSREQDTRVVMTAPLYAPTLEPRIRAAGAAAVATSAAMESNARHLVRDVKVAWHGAQQALAQKQVFEASARLLEENLRVHEVLLKQGKITRDAVLRAQAELLAVQQAVDEAQFQADNAARRLNVLTARPLETALRLPADAVSMKAGSGVEGLETYVSLDGFQLPPELRQLGAGLQARKSLEEAARKNYRPTVGLAVEAGYQGVDYSTGPGTGVAIASVVMNWKFSDGGLRDAQLGAASAARRQIELQQEDAEAQLEGILRSSGERVVLSLQQMKTAQARLQASEESFRIAQLKRESGNLSQLEFFDAQRVLTDARSAAVSAQAQLNVAAAEFELAKSSYPLPLQWLQIKEDSLKK